MNLAILLLLSQFTLRHHEKAHVNDPPKNAIVFVLDDVAAVDLELVSSMGGTPTIDGLAAQGVRFLMSCAPGVCAPSRRSLVFGRYWTRNTGPLCGGFDSDTPPLSETSIAEALPFHASAILGKWHVGGDPTGGPWECAPLVHGFDDWSAGHPANVNTPSCFPSNRSYTDWIKVEDCSSSAETTYEPFVVRDSFLSGWTATSGSKFAIVAAQLAHGPFHRPPDELLPQGWPATPTAIDKYHAMIAAYDTLIGEMLAVVDLSSTLVVVVGDNGTPFGPKAKGTSYERGIRVPMIFAHGPVAGVVRGNEVGELVHVVDIPATIADWAGTGVPASWDGISLMPTLTGAQHAQYRDAVIVGTPDGVVAARAHYFKLIDNVSSADEFYDLTMDPTETVNQLGNPAFAAEEAMLRAEVDAFRARP